MQKEYTQTKEQVLEGLRTDRQGLSAQEAEKRLQEHGENRLKEAEKLTLFQRFVQQLKDPMLLILLAAAAVSAVTNILSHESFTEVIIILLVVLLNAVLGVVQESKAEAAIEALQTMTAATCKVLRDGQQVTMESRLLVPGVRGAAGGGRCRPGGRAHLESASMKIEEAALTGESVPVSKFTRAPRRGTGVAGRPEEHGLHGLGGGIRPGPHGGHRHGHGHGDGQDRRCAGPDGAGGDAPAA